MRQVECKAAGLAAKCREVLCRYDAERRDALPCRTHPMITRHLDLHLTTACELHTSILNCS